MNFVTQFEELIREAFQSPIHEIDDFFEREFLLPLQNALDQDDKIPAEIIRQQRKQTKKLKQMLLTFAKKPL